MRDGQPSATAWRVALRRAAHQQVDVPVVFADPVAVPLLGAAAVAAFVEKDAQLGGARRAFSTALRAFVCARSALAEEQLALAQARAVQQYVVLGAGLDTFAYRNPYTHVRVFEVDYPATQAWKRQLLAAADIPVPDSLTFVPIDFERQSLADELQTHGFDARRPAIFAWLGVVPYLTPEAFARTAGYIGGLTAGTEAVFDYVAAGTATGFLEQAAYQVFALKLAALGEPIRMRISPAQLRIQLTAAGFTRVEDWTAETLNARYFAAHSDGLALRGRVGRIAVAAV